MTSSEKVPGGDIQFFEVISRLSFSRKEEEEFWASFCKKKKHVSYRSSNLQRL